MRILHLLKSNKFSGAENVVLTIMQLFPEYEMIYASPAGPIKEIVKSHGYAFYPLDGTNITSVRKAIKDISPDIVHAHDFSMSTSAAWAAGNIPVIAHLHSNPPWLKKINPKSLAFAFSLPLIKEVVSVSDTVQKDYLFRELLNHKNHVIRNIVNIERIQKLAHEENQMLPIVDLVFLGRLTEPKQPIKFCEIVKEIKEHLPEVQAYMIGEGELMENTQSRIKKYALEKNISLLGFQKNPYPRLAASKIMVMPSAWEGFGLAAIEALCLGKPVLCSGAGGLADIVDDSCGKICVSENDYVQEIIKLLGNRSYYKQKSINAKMRAERFCDMKEYKSKLEAIYAAAKSN